MIRSSPKLPCRNRVAPEWDRSSSFRRPLRLVSLADVPSLGLCSYNIVGGTSCGSMSECLGEQIGGVGSDLPGQVWVAPS